MWKTGSQITILYLVHACERGHVTGQAIYDPSHEQCHRNIRSESRAVPLHSQIISAALTEDHLSTSELLNISLLADVAGLSQTSRLTETCRNAVRVFPYLSYFTWAVVVFIRNSLDFLHNQWSVGYGAVQVRRGRNNTKHIYLPQHASQVKLRVVSTQQHCLDIAPYERQHSFVSRSSVLTGKQEHCIQPSQGTSCSPGHSISTVKQAKQKCEIELLRKALDSKVV